MSSPKLSRRDVMAGGLLALLAGGSAGAQSGAVVAKFRIEKNRVLIDALLNGKGPFPFAIDTGAVVSGVLEKTAKDVGLKKLRDVKLNGDDFPLYAADEVVLGGAVRMTDVALAGLWRLGGATGLLAAGLVTAFDSDLDFDTGEWRVYPQGAGERPGFTAIASSLPEHAGSTGGSRRIQGTVTHGDQPLSLLWDTGASQALHLPYEVASRLGLWNDDLPWSPAPITGITGTAPEPGRIVRAIRPIQIGPLSFGTPLIAVRGPKQPRSPTDDGLLGLPVMQRMNIAIDAKAGRVLVKSSGLPAPAEVYNRSGLWLDKASGGATIGQIGRGSPAEAAGLKVGDRVSGEWPDLLRALNGPAGSQLALKVAGKGAVVLILADYL